MAADSDEAITEASARHGELLLYDFFKHMTTLSVVTLGGVLSISQTTGIEVPVRDLLPSVALLTVAGASALYGMESIIKGRLANRALPKAAQWNRLVTGGSFGLGVGTFLGLFQGMF